MLAIKNLMTDCVVSTTEDAPITHAIDLMLKYQISGLPVLHEDITLAGIITEKDVLHLYNEGDYTKKIIVDDLMTRSVVTFDENDSLDDVCDCLIKNDFRRVPVLSEGKVVGIISRPDITRGILQTISRQRQIMRTS